MGKYAGYTLSVAILALGIIGARLQNNTLLFAMLGVIIVALLLVVFDRIDERQYPVLLFFIGLGLIYQVSLQTNYLVGTDIHYEYWFARQTYDSGSWDSSIGHSYNAATSISVFIPMMARLLHIPLEWAFKVIPPLFLAGVPVVVYHIFKREFDTRTAFLSVFFFISVPTMFLELSGLAKQAIGELFLISCLALIVYSNLKGWQRYGAIGGLAALTALAHYSMGGTLFFFLLGAVILFPIGKYIFRRTPNVSMKYLALTFVVFTVASGLFYGWAAKGAPLRDILTSAGITSGVIKNNEPVAMSQLSSSTRTDEPVTLPLTRTDKPVAGSSGYAHWVYPEPAVAVALGADFGEVDNLSRVFRIFQYATQILVVIGGIILLIQYKRQSLGYMVFLTLSGTMLALVIFYPGFSPLFNASRFYNLILLFIAPAMIVGGKLVFRNYKLLTIVVLIPYFLFTSGAIFEVAKVQSVYRITIPYSHSLSAIRLDTTALFTDNDIVARDWVKANGKFPVYGDMWGATAMFEVQSNLDLSGVNVRLKKELVHTFTFIKTGTRPDPIPDDCYILLRERNTEKQEITYQVGVGLRRTAGYNEVNFDEVLAGRVVLFQSGNAIVYGIKEK